MVPEEKDSVALFIVDTLLDHDSVDMQNAARSKLERDLRPDELRDMIIVIQESRLYKIQKFGENDYVISRNTNYQQEQLENEKLQYETKIAKRTYKTFWFAFYLSIAAFLISLAAIILQLLQ